ncbi:hypothetical protein [Burkholderia sp. PAMC 26561]|uniref:hypothetical protein n=1 Tax=Burkholderia sp. PAMC 26561 TaxID=1795043 RepID=UPI00084D0BFC|nr:hypothetical protein [Burkholderia sp. PAMC 26561]
MKAIIAADSDQIFGFTIAGSQAGEIVTTVQMAMLGKLPYTAVRDAIISHPTLGPDGKPDGFIMKASFESVAQQFGETIVQADQLFQALGANTDGLLSHDQFMNGIVGALKNADSAIS